MKQGREIFSMFPKISSFIGCFASNVRLIGFRIYIRCKAITTFNLKIQKKQVEYKKNWLILNRSAY